MLSEDVIEAYWWQPLPRDANQYDVNSPIFGRNHCRVCGSRMMPDQASHCRSSDHIFRMVQLIKIQRKRLSQYRSLPKLLAQARSQEVQICQLTHEPSKNELRALLFPFHKWEFENCELPDSLPSIEAPLNEYLHIERISILHLAVWKAITVVEFYDKTAGPHASWTWFNRGWKAHKKKTRPSGSIGTIVKLVIPFLRKP